MASPGAMTRARTAPMHSNGLVAARSLVVAISRILFMGLSTAYAAPLNVFDLHDDEPEAEGANLWVLYAASVILVLSGGAFAGLTIA